MKKNTMLAAFVAAMFMTPFALIANDSAAPQGGTGNAVATPARTEGTSPPARTFAYVDEVRALIAEGASGAVTLEATCGVELQKDGSFTDVTHPERPIAYDASGTEISESAYPDIASAPDSIRRKIELLAAQTSPKNPDTTGVSG